MGEHNAVGLMIKRAVDNLNDQERADLEHTLKQHPTPPAMTDHAQRARELWQNFVAEDDPDYPTPVLDRGKWMMAQIADALTQAHAAGRRAGLEEAAKLASSLAGKAHTYASENADVYHAYDNGLKAAAQAIRANAKEGA